MNYNPQLELAEQYVCSTGVSVFLTGKAGTGKTTFLKHIVEKTAKRYVVVAPTGVAAVNAGGVTIHSFFQLPLCPYLPEVKELVTEYQMPEHKFQMRKERLNIIRTLELLIIDEISMVRADLLDAIDMMLRRCRHTSRPFGGVQLLMIGDVHQLPPVVTESERPYMERVYPSPFFFNSKALQRIPYVTIELQTVYRQQDAAFVDLLNKVRDNQADADVLKTLNKRCLPAFDPDRTQYQYIRLTTHNAQSDAINRKKLEELKGRSRLYEAKIDGTYPDSCLPTEASLRLKEGEQVMFVKNDSSGKHRYYNGKIATIESLTDEGVQVRDESGDLISVDEESWENISYRLDETDNEIKAHVEGTFVQVPLRPAWAVTIHKAQGLTFDHVVVDAAQAFTFGQVYVALSRCRSLEGLVLSSPISERCLFGNDEVATFCQQQPSEDQMRDLLPGCQRDYYLDELAELFDFEPMYRYCDRLNSIFQQDLRRTYPVKADLMSRLTTGRVIDLMNVGEKFVRQLRRMASEGLQLDKRIGEGTGYFFDQLAEVGSVIPQLIGLDIDNQEVASSYKEAADALKAEFGIKHACLKQVREDGFNVEAYLKTKVDTTLNSTKKTKSKSDMDASFDALEHPQLARNLRSWRAMKAKETNVPAFAILPQKSLLSIADTLPTSTKELAKVTGMGKTRTKNYGREILEVIADYCRETGRETISMDLE